MNVATPLSLALFLSVQGAVAQPATPRTDDDHIDTVQVTAPKVPLDKAIPDFVKSYTQTSSFSGKITRWRDGICPQVQGYIPPLAASVTHRVREVATEIGAPVDPDPKCKPNVMIYFTREPQALLNQLIKKLGADTLGYHDGTQTKQLATFTHPVQAWYPTATRDENGLLGLDDAQLPCPTCATGPKVVPVRGSRLNDGLRSELGRVIIIADSSKLVDYDINSRADYVSMLALSQTQAFETCQPLVSITNLLAPRCDASLKPDILSPSDIAYLSALYKMNPDSGLQFQQSEIAHQMETELGGH